MFILHSHQFKPKSYLKFIKKYVFSEGEQFPLSKHSAHMGKNTKTVNDIE